MEVVVPSVSKLGIPGGYEGDRFRGPALTVAGVNWKLLVQKRDDFIDVLLSAEVEIISDVPNKLKYMDTYDVKAKFKLVSFSPYVDSVEKIMDPNEYRPPYYQWGSGNTKGCKKFIRWTRFNNRHFVWEDKAIFVVEFTVGELIPWPDRPRPKFIG